MKDLILDELARNYDHYKELVTPLVEKKNLLLKTEDTLFYNDIKKQLRVSFGKAVNYHVLPDGTYVTITNGTNTGIFKEDQLEEMKINRRSK